MSESVPTNAVDQALTDAIGLHSGWVLAIECYDDDGSPKLAVMWDTTSTQWTRLGMAHALVTDLTAMLNQHEEDK